jgi:hypothetical protein
MKEIFLSVNNCAEVHLLGILKDVAQPLLPDHSSPWIAIAIANFKSSKSILIKLRLN